MSLENQKRPSIGRTVHYRLTADDAAKINRRRADASAKMVAIVEEKPGYQVHVGNQACEGDVVPLIVVKVWADEFGVGACGVNGQAMLDGNDQFWVTSAGQGEEPGKWCWPPLVR